MSDQWVVMFVDMQGSTEIKYRTDEREVSKIISRLYRVIHQVAEHSNMLKFTGDGAMIGYAIDPDQPSRQPLRALRDAVKIIQTIDRLNYRFDGPPIHIRVGITSGQCRRFTEGANDLIGKQVDLASRLCQDAIPDSMLVDEATLKKAGLDPSTWESKSPLDGPSLFPGVAEAGRGPERDRPAYLPVQIGSVDFGRNYLCGTVVHN